MDPVMVEHHVDKRWLRIEQWDVPLAQLNGQFRSYIFCIRKCSPRKLTLPAKHINRLQLNRLIPVLIILGDHDNHDLREW